MEAADCPCQAGEVISLTFWILQFATSRAQHNPVESYLTQHSRVVRKKQNRGLASLRSFPDSQLNLFALNTQHSISPVTLGC